MSTPETFPPSPIFHRAILVQGLTDWVCVHQIFYDGEAYDYASSVGSLALTYEQAQDRDTRNNGYEKSLLQFLQDVPLLERH